ncbi:hypothetical protein IEQ34_007570 [Dendrobium chrysotoxum]|uniref:BESS domain-containing protein n=1 Tax=Dendrobium chrysotoxum TaxID=161865 RepID=A0AAV7H4S7_DENCH|nr:hypothetical protein IEQ34_007570 [Dendrobium chrysotoxum]
MEATIAPLANVPSTLKDKEHKSVTMDERLSQSDIRSSSSTTFASTQMEKERPSLGEFLSHLGTLLENDPEEDDLKKDDPLEDEDLKMKCLAFKTYIIQ